MVETLLQEVREHVAETSKPIEHAKAALRDTCDDAFAQSRRVLRKARRAAEDLADDAGYAVKKHPVPSMAGAVVFGLALGFVAGWLLTSRE